MIPGRFYPSPAGQTTREEGVEVIPQVVDDAFCEFLWKSSRRGLNELLCLEEFRQHVLVKRGSQLGEERGLLGIDLRVPFVKKNPEQRANRRSIYTSMPRRVDEWWLLSTDATSVSEGRERRQKTPSVFGP